MYAQLLTMTLADEADLDGGAHHAPLDELVGELVAKRRVLARDPDLGRSAVSEIARQLTYDAQLVRICRRLGIEADPGRFEQPADERDRLEGLLAAEGIELRRQGRRD